MKKLLIVLGLFGSHAMVAQEMIYATIAGGDLYAFDIYNCTSQFIGSTGQGFGDIAFTPNGRLWGIVNYELYEIDPLTANAELVGFTGVGSVSLVALNDSTLLTEADLQLYALNTNDASSYVIGTIGYGASGDLTWYDNDLYMLTPLIKIVLDDSFTSIVDVIPVSLDIPICEGAATASFGDEWNSIVGFQGEDLIKVCHIDGSYELLCPGLNVGGTPGAASIRLATQIPEPIACCDSSPTINCPENISVEAESFESSVEVLVPVPDVFQDCGTYVLTNDFNTEIAASGNYPIGTTTVVYTATDEIGNAASCAVQVSVVQIPSNCCPGDYNCDGVVSVLDLIILVGEFGCMSDSCNTDLNDDNVIGFDDMQLFVGLFGNVGYCD